MSAIAIDLLDRLRESGMADDKARKIAEAVDARVEEAMREVLKEAKRHAEQADAKSAAQSAEKSDAKYAAKSEVEIREKQFARREETESQFARLLGEIREARAEAKSDNRALQKDIRYLGWGVALILVVLLTNLVMGFF